MSDAREKFQAYADTVLELHGVPDGRIDLRRRLGDVERRALVHVGLDGPFAVLTAENPHGNNEEDAPNATAEAEREAANDRHLAALIATLADRRIPFVRVDGVAPDGSYRERCVAILTTREMGVELAARFGQIALFWFDGNAFWLLPAEAQQAPRRLP